MKSQGAQTLIDQVDLAITEIKGFICLNTPEIEKSYLAKFLVVFVCGIYEETIETILKQMLKKYQSPELDKFFEIYISYSFSNPKCNKIMDLLNRFNSSWGDIIEALPENNKDAINSIVNNKNAIAHGRPCNLTIQDVENFYNDSKLIIEKIDDILL